MDTTRDIVRRHLAAWRRGDVAALIQDYADNAVILLLGGEPVAGKEPIADMYNMIFSSLFPPDDTVLLISDEMFVEEYALFRWSARSSIVEARNGFEFLRVAKGEIVCQSSGSDLTYLRQAPV